MPSINPIQLRRVSPIPINASGNAGRVRVGAGTIGAPKIAQPAYLQFIGQDTSYGMRTGQEASQFADQLNQAVIQHAMQVGQAEGREHATKFMRQQDDAYYGTPDKGTGAAVLSGKQYVQASDAYLEQYKQQQSEYAKSLDHYARAEFAKLTQTHYDGMRTTIRNKRIKEQTAYISESQNVARQAIAKVLSQKAFTILQDIKTLEPEELAIRRQDLDTAVIGEAVRRAQEDGIPKVAALDSAIYDTLQQIYTTDGGDAVAALFEDRWFNTITDPEVRKKAEGLHAEYITRQTAAIEAHNKYETESAEYDWREMEQDITTKLMNLNNPADAAGIVKKAYEQSSYAGKQAAALSKALLSDKPETLASRDFTTRAKMAGWTPMQAAEKAEVMGISLNKKQLTAIGNAAPLAKKTENAEYVKRLDAEFANLFGLPSDMTARYLAKAMGDSSATQGDRLISMWRSQLLAQLQKADVSGEGPGKEKIYMDFISDRLDPTKVRAEGMKFESKDSIVPVGLFKRIKPESIHSYRDLGNQMTRQAGSVLKANEIAAVKKAARKADDTTLQPELKEQYRQRLRTMYTEIQKRIFRRSPHSDMAPEWMREVPFQWFGLESRIYSAQKGL